MEDASRQAVVDAGRRLIDDGLVEGTAGNVSVRFGDRMAISPSSMPYDRVRPEDVCVLDLDGNLLDGARPSTEAGLHLGIYRDTDAGAVIHHHGIRSVTVSTVVDELPALHYYVVRLGGPVRVAPYHRYGTVELAGAVASALRDRNAALMQNHGAVTYGTDVDEAFDRAQLLEWLCDLYIRASSIGSPRVLSEAELTEAAAAMYTR